MPKQCYVRRMKQANLAVVILAAGKGTRMKSVRPKVMHDIAGLPMLGHVMRTAESLHPERIVVIAAPDQVDAFRPVVGAHEIVVQTEQLGTGHAVQCAAPALKNFTGDVLVLYGDVPLVRAGTLQALLDKKHETNATVALPGFIAKNPQGYGRMVTAGDHLLCIVEEKDALPEQRVIQLCYAGIMALSAPDVWKHLGVLSNQNASGEYYLTELVAAAHQACFTITDETEVMGINDRAQLAAAESAWQARRRTEFMQWGAALQNPDSVTFSYDTKISPDVTIGANVVFGPGVRVESGAQILPFCHLEGCVIERDARVGPFARIRPGSCIGVGAHIGNFVEIKNTDFAAGAKAGHLSYIGDATVGEGANIGAGTITCNYDGIAKHKTEIGAGAFIGSNTALVAPVSVGEGAITGAGSVITENVPAGALALARGVQKNIAAWALKFFEKKVRA